MQLDHHVAQVHAQLGAAAALGDDRTREIAQALATAATPAVRLALLNAVAEAADEITAALLDYPGSPSVNPRLDGDDITIDVTATPPAPPAEEAEPRRDDGDPSARISLRLTESLKAEIDAAAERDGISVNTWLVRAATAALHQPSGPAADAGPGFGWDSWGRNWSPNWSGGGGRGRNRRESQQHVTGWING